MGAGRVGAGGPATRAGTTGRAATTHLSADLPDAQVGRFALLSASNPARWFETDSGGTIRIDVERDRDPLGDPDAAVAAIGWGYRSFNAPGPLTEAETLILPRGEGVLAISRRLADAGIVRDFRVFAVGVRLHKAERRLRAGEYRFPAQASMLQVMQQLAAGETVVRRLTLPEGLTVEGSWIEPGFNRCFQLMACDDARLLQEWILGFRGLGVRFEIVPVVPSAETRAVVEPFLPED